MCKLIRTVLPVILLASIAGSLRAASEGQADLDKATDSKLNADTISDLSEVIRLAESAMQKGLDKANTDFARKLLASTLVQRAQEAVKQVLTGANAPTDFRQKRKFALADLEKAVKLDPKQPEVYLLIAQLNLVPGGDVKRAREAIDKALALGFEDTSARAKALALRSCLQEQPQKQLADLDEAVRLMPSDVTMVRTRALLLADMNKLERGSTDLNEVIKLAPDNGPTYEAKAVVLARMKKYDEALATLDKAQELSPHSVMPLIERARIHTQQAKLDAAVEDLNQALAMDPGDVTVLMMRASLYQDKGDKGKALADVEHVLKLNPKSALAIRARAVLLAESDRIDEAVDELERLPQLDPKDTLTLLQLAILYTAQKKPAKAIETYTALLAVDPTDWRAFRGRADAYLELGNQAEAHADYEKARGELEKLHKLNPKDTASLLQLAVLYAVEKKPAKSIETYTAALAVDPNEWHALRGRGDTYLNIGKQAEAIADYEKALKLEPKDHSILNNLAWVLATSPDAKLRNGHRAVELATLACKVTDYKLAFILSTLAAAYAETGDFATAMKWSANAVEVGDKEDDDSLKKELESYKAKKPWRELLSEEKSASKSPGKLPAKHWPFY
jgi:tetratricopeptide (TPR) repeat protein